MPANSLGRQPEEPFNFAAWQGIKKPIFHELTVDSVETLQCETDRRLRTRGDAGFIIFFTLKVLFGIRHPQAIGASLRY